MSDIITIDTCGLSCPQPVLLALNAIKRGGTAFDVRVDNDASRENVSRAAAGHGFAITEEFVTDGLSDNECVLHLRKNA